MRYFVAVILISLSFVFVFNSCNSIKYQKEIAHIDSLLAVIDSSYINLNSLDTAAIKEHYSIYVENLKLLRETFTDKDDDNTWSIYTRYGLIRKPLRDFQKHFDNFTYEIDKSKEQLTILKLNIIKKPFKPHLIKKYIEDEEVFVSYIKISVDNLMENTKKYNDMFLELNPKVEALLNNKSV